MEIKWTESCLKDIGNEKEFLKVKNVLERNIFNLHIRTKQINLIHKNVRRLRIVTRDCFCL